MHFKQYNNLSEFYEVTLDLLMCHEAQNVIPLGNIIMGNKGEDKSGWRDPANWFMATVSDDVGVQLTAIMTPPHNLTLYARENKIDEAVVECLIEGIGDVPVPGIMAKKDMALYFADEYCSAKGLIYKTAMEQRLYELTEVNPDIAQIGTMRSANESDMYFLPFWLEAFYSAETYGKTVMDIPQDTEPYLDRIRQGKVFILEVDGKPVSIAGPNREMKTVCGVGNVFTPPYYRGKGYATSLVAKLSRMILDRGFKKCVLYTDLANATSNNIYQKIGYRPICDSVMLSFTQPAQDVI